MSDMQLFDPFSTDAVNELFKGLLRPIRFELATPTPAPNIKLEVSEREDAFLVKAEIPGVRKEDISVKIDGDRVSISAETRQEKDEKRNGKVLKSELYYGAASRVLSLGSDVDAEKASAKYENGVLQLMLPKRPSSATRKLPIQ
jgi:HSP20 family protein